MTYYAHTRQTDASAPPELQTVADHLAGVSALSQTFAAAFGASPYGYAAGAVHDIGKCTEAFQKRLLADGPIVDHAAAGAVLCARHGLLHTAACAAGHHGGLPDYGNARTDCAGDSTLYGRLKKGIAEKYLEQCGESGAARPLQFPPAEPDGSKLQQSFWTRMLYSCLVDADYLDTEAFMTGSPREEIYDDIPTLLGRLQNYISRWQTPKTELNRLRCNILRTCIEAAENRRGLYTLTVPTGGGKTVASLAFALHHAALHKMQRVIYVIPYTSIIEQNAQVFRDILGGGNVLEHHSGVQFDLSDGAPPEEIQRALAAENWDMPVIVTTSVQLFESIYANRSSKCRKLHNLANSVIIFDEAQMIPLAHLRPCAAAMASLAEQFRSTVVLCTATQPSLNDLMQTYAPNTPVEELCPLSRESFERFRRTSFSVQGVIEDSNLAQQLAEREQVLCVVNSRKAAQNLFSLLPEEGSFHLSTLMIPAQRKEKLSEIRRRLSNGETCRVVSTSLIEAGVDVDFPAVYRELAGLDSVLQAAGRCNREGKRSVKDSVVTVFERTEPPPALFQTAIGAAREALALAADPGSPEAITQYFRSLRALSGNALDKHGVVRAFETGIDGCDFPFKTVAGQFRLLEENTYTIYIPYGRGARLIAELQAGAGSKALYRELGQYAVAVYPKHFAALYAAGAIATAKEIPALDERSAVLTDMSLYSEALGLSVSVETGKAVFC